MRRRTSICALVSLQLQAGLDGFLAIEKYVLKRRGLFVTDRRREPFGWSLDEETREEVDRLLAILDRGRRIGETVPGEGEVSTVIVELGLDLVELLAVAPRRQRPADHDVNTPAAGGELGVAVEVVNEPLGGSAQSAIVADASVEIHTRVGIIGREDETDACGPIALMCLDGLGECPPGPRVGGVGELPGPRGAWWFGLLAVPLLPAPHDPLIELLQFRRDLI